jgi:hypothetical protein
VVLDEAIDACRGAPIKPSLGLRFALMFLYALSDGDRGSFDEFWRIIQSPEDNQNETAGRYIRATLARTHMTGIARSVGRELGVTYSQKLSLARKPQEERRQILQREAELAEHRRRLIEDGWSYQEKDRERLKAAADSGQPE